MNLLVLKIDYCIRFIINLKNKFKQMGKFQYYDIVKVIKISFVIKKINVSQFVNEQKIN